MRTALTVAGSDSCGGAGIQADIKAMNALGVHAATVITAVTAQNTCSVSDIYPMPADSVQAQLDAVLKDCDVKAVKTGMLYSAEIVGVVADALEEHDVPLIVDPVMVATVGDRLYDNTFVRALKEKLIPVCELVTPNKHEAEKLTGLKIRNEDDAAYACEILGKEGCSVLLKGGHIAGDQVTDYLYLSADITPIVNPRLPVEAGHGSGCTLSAFITANMANGLDLVTSVNESRKMIQKSIEAQYRIGQGVPTVNPNVRLTKKEDSAKVDIIRELDAAVDELAATVPLELVPKAGMNLAFAKKNARGPEEIGAVEKRMTVHNGNVKKGGPVKYGAAEHLSYVLMEIMKTNPEIRCVLEIGADKDLPRDFRNAGLEVVPIKRVTGESVSKSLRNTLDGCEKFPDVIYDLESKNPKVNIFGKYPRDVISKFNRIF
ncbi:MAG: bifunctional hydroxymethylpyrimidine kinase/phosphomethylpyrimidine kinase [Candidatus Methanomethylophilus sp.]|nr:bifunctional hydroxymethylpyrimidine kinase/phosphomethylpyrimidine kinase [Methanomethylophilus sp.]